MSTVPIPLDSIRVASPCSAAWDQMSGDDQARFCSQCSLHVYNLSELTKEEAEALVMEKEGKMCVRFYQRADGTMLTKDCPVGWQRVKRRLLMFTSFAVTFIVGVLSFVSLGALAVPAANRDRPSHGPARRIHDYFYPPQKCIMGKM